MNEGTSSAVEPVDQPSDSEDADKGIKFKDWGFKVDRLFEVAYRFYKRYESKAFYPTFDERNQMNALILQARYGNYDSDKVPDVGMLDLVGKNRQHQWSLLKGLSRMEAMSKFVCTLDEICPLFKAHAEAVKLSSSHRSPEGDLDQALKDGRNRSDSQKIRDELQSETADQLAIIKKSLSRQTFSQFKSYAEKQHPNDTLKQKQLIDSLQEQYYQQYISQMYPNSPSSSTNFTNSNTNGNIHQQATQISNLLIPQEQSQDVRIDLNTSSQSNEQPSTFQPQQSESEHSAINEQPYFEELSKEISSLNFQTNNANPEPHPAAEVNGLDQLAMASFVAEHSLEQLLLNQNDSSCSTLSEESSSNQRSIGCEALEPASIWTKKNVKEFRESLVGDPLAGEYLLKQGKLVTLQVPTYPNGKYIYWEFITDDYDIGFGLDFAYEDSQKQETLELKIFEQTDDEDDDDGDEDLIESEAKIVRDTSTTAINLSQSTEKERNSDKPPKVENTIAIIPTYRRNSHEEVFIGKHRYPGHGYYLLRFDNTYSVLRSKSLHFRICYFI